MLFLAEGDNKTMETLSLCYSVLMPLLWGWAPHKELLLRLSLLFCCMVPSTMSKQSKKFWGDAISFLPTAGISDIWCYNARLFTWESIWALVLIIMTKSHLFNPIINCLTDWIIFIILSHFISSGTVWLASNWSQLHEPQILYLPLQSCQKPKFP